MNSSRYKLKTCHTPAHEVEGLLSKCQQRSARGLKPHTESIRRPVPDDFDFWLTARSSGWIDLAPFAHDEEKRAIYRVERLANGKILRATLTQEERGALNILAESVEAFNSADVKELKSMVETCLKLDEDFTPLYSLLEGYPQFRWVAEIGAGRSVRCPTVFEDVVKTICTTNASWGLTKGITRRLCEKLGESFSGE